MKLLRHAALVSALVVGIGMGTSTAAGAGGSSTITGHVWQDLNRNGVMDAGEVPFSGEGIMLFDSTGSNVASASTAADGSFSFSGLADGTYTVKFATQYWWNLRSDWVPTTTGSLYYSRTVNVAGSATADIGLRPIVRSTDVSNPISSYTAANGLIIHSYDDVVSAQDIWSALSQGTLMGPEAATTTVYFDYGTQTDATWSVAGANGTYSSFSASLWIAYLSWLDSHDNVLFHEYGHDWGNYNADIVQQDDTYTAYLKARGVYGDSRLYSSKAWDPNEMLAEDYRQLFGSATAASYPQANTDIPPASQVVGLKDFLQNTYTQPPTTSSTSTSTSTSTTTSPTLVTISGLSVNPQPISSTATISFVLSEQATVTVNVLNSSGSLVRCLMSNVPANGSVSTKWDRKDSSGHRVKSGTYTVTVSATDAYGDNVVASTPAKVS